MIRPGFLSLSERRELEVCVRSQREDHGVARRANAILLLDDGKSGSSQQRYRKSHRDLGIGLIFHAFSWFVTSRFD